MPPRDNTPTPVVPPPTSTTIEPVGWVTGRPAPIAAAIGSSIRKTRLAPALSAGSRIPRRSPAVEPDGTHTMWAGRAGPHLGAQRHSQQAGAGAIAGSPTARARGRAGTAFLSVLWRQICST